jgi:hypothetical protein
MPQLYLPADHSDADLVLAGQVAELLESAELHVTWTPAAGQAAPEIPALLREPQLSRAEALGELLFAARGLWRAVTARRRPRPARPLAAPAPPTAADRRRTTGGTAA